MKLRFLGDWPCGWTAEQWKQHAPPEFKLWWAVVRQAIKDLPGKEAYAFLRECCVGFRDGPGFLRRVHADSIVYNQAAAVRELNRLVRRSRKGKTATSGPARARQHGQGGVGDESPTQGDH